MLDRYLLIIQCFRRDENASTAIEYALITALLAVASIPALGGLGIKLGSTYSIVNNALSDAASPTVGSPGVADGSRPGTAAPP